MEVGLQDGATNRVAASRGARPVAAIASPGFAQDTATVGEAIVEACRERDIPFARREFRELRALGTAAQRRRPGRRAQPCCAPALVRSRTVIAEATALATSDRFDGTIMMQCSNLGQFVGPPAVAAAVATTGRWGDAVYVMVAAAALTLACGLAVARDERRAGLA